MDELRKWSLLASPGIPYPLQDRLYNHGPRWKGIISNGDDDDENESSDEEDDDADEFDQVILNRNRYVETRACAISPYMRRMLRSDKWHLDDVQYDFVQEIVARSQVSVSSLSRMANGIFLTGAAGCGKTHLIRAVVEQCRLAGLNVLLAGTTGMAACSLPFNAGCTLHALFGLTGESEKQSIELVLHRLRRYRPAVLERLALAHLLVIDEVSMMNVDLFNKCDALLRTIRKRPYAPFGGLTVLLVGDFCQLPPVQITNPANKAKANQPLYIFQSALWTQLIGDRVWCLKKNYRQERDPAYAQWLNVIRYGSCPPEAVNALQGRVVTDWRKLEELERSCASVFTTNAKRDACNARITRYFAEEQAMELCEFRTVWRLESTSHEAVKLVRSYFPTEQDLSATFPCLLEQGRLRVGIGMPVMIRLNLAPDEHIVNGSLGKVIQLDTEKTEITVRFTNTDTGECFEHVIKPHKYVMPVSVALENGTLAQVKIVRQQFPLIPAMANNGHKVQGLTLGQALIDPEPCQMFPGMMYVLLSRVSTLDGLFLRSFRPELIQAEPAVVKAYQYWEQLPDKDTSRIHCPGLD